MPPMPFVWLAAVALSVALPTELGSGSEPAVAQSRIHAGASKRALLQWEDRKEDQAKAPAAPTSVRATVDTDGSVSLAWDPLPTGTVTAYVILGTRTGQPRSAVTGRLPVYPTRHTIPRDRLVEGAEYSFQVAAINVETKGPPSVASRLITIPAAVLQPPGEQQAVAPERPVSCSAQLNAADGTISVSWQPAAMGAAATSYVVLATRAGQPRHAVSQRIAAPGSSYVIPRDRLMEGASYVFQVGPLNGDTHGPPSPESNQVVVPGVMPPVQAPPAETAPRPPKPTPGRVQGCTASVSVEGAVTVMWEPLPAGTATSYVILAAREGEPRHAVTTRLPIAPTWHTLAADRLVAGSKYVFQVAATNGDTHGPPSEASISLNIPLRSGNAAKPVQQAQFAVSAILNADSSVSLVWHSGTEAPNHAFVVMSERSGRQPIALTDPLSGSTTAYTIPPSELVPGATYRFRIKDVGQGEGALIMSEISNAVHVPNEEGPHVDAESMPKIPVVTNKSPPKVQNLNGAYSGGKLTLKWDADMTTNSYLVKYSQVGGTDWHWLPNKPTTRDSQIEVTGLQSGKDYHFIALGQNSFGQGPWSDASPPLRIDATPPPVLPPPTATVKAHAVRVRWNVPALWAYAGDAAGSHIRILAYKHQNGGHCADCLLSFDASPRDEFKKYMTIKSIDRDAKYTFRVVGFNSVGMGHPSSPSEMVDTGALIQRSQVFTALWIIAEVLLILVVSVIILCIWRRRKEDMDAESRVKYMELSPIREDWDGSWDGGQRLQREGEDYFGENGTPFVGSHLEEEPPLGGSLVNTLVSIEAALSDICERTHLREYCEEAGLLDYFKFFQAVEDLHRCSHPQSVKAKAAEIESNFMDEAGQYYIELHPDTLYKVQNLKDFGDDAKAVYDGAQQEAIATLKLIVYRTYMRERHQMVYEASSELSPLDEAFVLVESPLYFALLRMLNSQTDRMKLMSLAEEVDATGWIEFFSCVEAYRALEPEQMPQEAHSIVEKFMSSDSGLKLSFSNQVAQELINTVTPHQCMFDRAQREAFHVFVHTLCLESPASTDR